MNLPSKGQLAAFGGNALSFAAGAVTLGATLRLYSGGDASQLQTAIQQLGSGIAQVVAAVSTIAGVLSGVYAAWSASHASQQVKVLSQPDVASITKTDGTVLTTPADVKK